MAQSTCVNMVVAEPSVGGNCVDGSFENMNQVVADSTMADDCVSMGPLNVIV